MKTVVNSDILLYTGFLLLIIFLFVWYIYTINKKSYVEIQIRDYINKGNLSLNDLQELMDTSNIPPNSYLFFDGNSFSFKVM